MTDAPAVAEAARKFEPDAVFHLAGRSTCDERSAIRSRRDRQRRRHRGRPGGGPEGGRAVRVRVDGRGNLRRGAARPLPLAEEEECVPDSPYGQSKLAAEGHVAYFRRVHEVPAAVLRLGNVYGPRQDLLGEAGVIAILCGKLADGGDPIVYGDGHQTRDYVYVGDVVEAMLVADQRLVAAGTDGALTYNIGTGLETSVLHLVERLGRIGDRSDFTPHGP